MRFCKGVAESAKDGGTESVSRSVSGTTQKQQATRQCDRTVSANICHDAGDAVAVILSLAEFDLPDNYVFADFCPPAKEAMASERINHRGSKPAFNPNICLSVFH